MTTQNQFKAADIFMDYFAQIYKKRFKSIAIINRSKFKYGVVDMLKGLSMKEAKQLADYYISHYADANINDFLYRYDDLIEEMNTEAADLEQRKFLLSDTKSAVERFRERYGKS